MKQVVKQAAVIAAYLFIVWGLCAQVHTAGSADIVVLMDTSGTILPYYHAINDQVLHSIITRFVKKGDTFHLLSFSAEPCYEMSQTINTEADLSRVVSRFMLLYQLGNSADFLAGLHFTAAYMKTLPPQRSKTVIVISDGIFNPPPDSPYTGYTDEQIKTELAKITADIRHNKWSVYYVKLPFPQEAVIKNLDGNFYTGTPPKIAEQPVHTPMHSTAGSIARPATGSINTTKTATSRTQEAAAEYSESTNISKNREFFEDRRDNTNEENYVAAAGVSGTTGISKKLETHSAADIKKHYPSASAHYTPPELNSPDTAFLITDTASRLNANTTKHGTPPKTAEQPPYAPTHSTAGSIARPAIGSISTTKTATNRTQEAVAKYSESTNISKNREFFEDRRDNTNEENYAAAAAAPPPPTTINNDSIPLHQPANTESISSTHTIPPQYTDVSKAFTANLGIKPDIVPKAGDISFNNQTVILPEISIPQQLAASGKTLVLPLQFKNTNDTPLELHITAITFSYKSVISQFIPDAQKLILHPEKDDVHTITLAIPEQFRNEGRYTADIRIDGEVNGNYRFSHAESVKLTITASWFRQTVRKITDIPKSLVKAAGFGIITFVLLLIAGRLVIRYSASLRNSAGRKLVYSSKGQKLSANSREFRYPVISRTDSAQQPFIISEIIELFVINQNTAIGKRNIHLLKAGSVMTIGGAKRDDFLIFLVPFPPALAEIHYTGTQYTLVINKPEFFPYEQEPVIQNCIGKIITIISDKGYPVSFMFRGYQDPTAQLNALLTSIQKKR